MPESTRAYIYRVLLALAPIAAAYGIVEDSELGLWMALASAVLGNGLAAVNTSTSADDG